jgi:hypothetical protein
MVVISSRRAQGQPDRRPARNVRLITGNVVEAEEFVIRALPNVL